MQLKRINSSFAVMVYAFKNFPPKLCK